MRVLETDSSITYKMGKSKRHRIRKAKENEAEDSSDDAQGLLYFIFHHHRKCCNFNFAKLINSNTL